MKIFEFYFNPPLKEKEKLEADSIFESFCFEPKNIYEKRMGSLYIIGSLKNILPKNVKFLEKLAYFIKDKYYKRTILTPEKSLRKVLKEANEFLEQIITSGDVSWLGNLSFAIFAIKDYKLNFTKVGGIKILLLRAGKLVDIEKKIRLQDIEPYPLKVFGNIVSGKLIEDDLLLVFTENVFNFFEGEKIIEKIIQKPSGLEEIIKSLSEQEKEKFKKIQGLLLAISFIKETAPSKKEIIAPQTTKEFSLKEVFQSYFQVLKKFFSFKIFKRFTFFPKITLNKRVIFILSFLILLLLGYLISNFEAKQKTKIYLGEIEEIERNLERIEKKQIDDELAKILLKESYKKISVIKNDLSRVSKDFSKRVLNLDEKIEKELFSFYKLEEIKEPDIYFNFEPKKFIPQKMLFSNGEFYLFSPFSPNIFKIEKEKRGIILEIDKRFSLACLIDDLPLFFSKPNQIIILKDNKFSPLSLKSPYSDSEFSDLVCKDGSIYFLDTKLGQVVQYFLLKPGENYKIGEPELLLEKATNANSISFDDNLWLLDKDTILKYKYGELKEKIRPDVFPEPDYFSKIYTNSSLPYFFILEPSQKRILIFEKSGKIYKQIFSEKFDALLDFAVSEDGKTIFILNGLTLYQVQI